MNRMKIEEETHITKDLMHFCLQKELVNMVENSEDFA